MSDRVDTSRERWSTSRARWLDEDWGDDSDLFEFVDAVLDERDHELAQANRYHRKWMGAVAAGDAIAAQRNELRKALEEISVPKSKQDPVDGAQSCAYCWAFDPTDQGDHAESCPTRIATEALSRTPTDAAEVEPGSLREALVELRQIFPDDFDWEAAYRDVLGQRTDAAEGSEAAGRCACVKVPTSDAYPFGHVNRQDCPIHRTDQPTDDAALDEAEETTDG